MLTPSQAAARPAETGELGFDDPTELGNLPLRWYFNRDSVLASCRHTGYEQIYPQYVDFEADYTDGSTGLPIQFVDGTARRYELDWIDTDFDIDKSPDWSDLPF